QAQRVAETAARSPSAVSPPAGQPTAAGTPSQGAAGDVATSAADEAAGGGDREGASAPAADPSAKAAYVARLRAWIAARQQYPRQARARRQEGEGVVRFRIDATGRLLSAELRRSAGAAALDAEMLALLRRAEPMPPIPPALGLAYLELDLPVSFMIH
ncbi:MAG: energy transducer TonB, partial [Rhodobacteraceae bacterium]